MSTALWYCYRLQAWIRAGLVARCGHREPMSGCYACWHVGDGHAPCPGCGEGAS